MNSPFAKIYPGNQGSLQKKAFLVLIIALFLIYKSNAVWDNEDANGDGIVTPLEEEEAIATSDSWAIPGIILFFSSIGLLVFGWFRDKRADPNTRLCLSCNETVKISDIMQNISFEVLGVTDTTQAVTTNNTVTGLTASGGKISPTVGNIQTTSYVPIKMGRVRISSSCPSCQNTFQWVEDRQVNQWTDSNGNFTYDILGNTILP